MVAMIILAKLATLDLHKLNVFCHKDYAVIMYVHDVINKVLSHGSSYIMDVVL